MSVAHPWIEKLQLSPHPEGGYFKEIYRCNEQMASLPTRFKGPRVFSTSAYYLLEGQDFSAFHRIHSDEVWHFYDGSGLKLHLISANGHYQILKLGRDLKQEQFPQQTVPHGTWFAAELIDSTSFALVGCTVAPGFDFQDFELADREELLELFPHHQSLVTRLTREKISKSHSGYAASQISLGKTP